MSISIADKATFFFFFFSVVSAGAVTSAFTLLASLSVRARFLVTSTVTSRLAGGLGTTSFSSAGEGGWLSLLYSRCAENRGNLGNKYTNIYKLFRYYLILSNQFTFVARHYLLMIMKCI